MLSLLILIFTHAQTGSEPSQIPNSSMLWCRENARIKDELVGSVACVWQAQPKPYPLPSIPGKIYNCRNFPGGSTASGYEGRLSCPSPFTSAADYIIYECAVCFTSDNKSGVVDATCRQTMYDRELGMCDNSAAALDFFHDVSGLVTLPLGPPIPPVPPYN